MPDQPPPLSNGFVWFACTLMPSAKVRLLEQRLTDVRHQLMTRDVSDFCREMRSRRSESTKLWLNPEDRELWLTADTEIELWVHPEDQIRAGVVLHEILYSVTFGL
jgi:hypothetical protein